MPFDFATFHHFQSFRPRAKHFLVMISNFNYQHRHQSPPSKTWSIHEKKITKPGLFANINTRNNVWDLPTIHQWSHFSRARPARAQQWIFIFKLFLLRLSFKTWLKRQEKMDKVSVDANHSCCTIKTRCNKRRI